MAVTPKDAVWFTRRRCPRCDSKLLDDGSLVWCSHIAGRDDPPRACDFGIAEKVSSDDPRIREARP